MSSHYTIHWPSTGGKAGKGRNRTSSVQVRDKNSNCIVKQFRFIVGNRKSWTVAINKALQFIDKELQLIKE